MTNLFTIGCNTKVNCDIFTLNHYIVGSFIPYEWYKAITTKSNKSQWQIFCLHFEKNFCFSHEYIKLGLLKNLFNKHLKNYYLLSKRQTYLTKIKSEQKFHTYFTNELLLKPRNKYSKSLHSFNLMVEAMK